MKLRNLAGVAAAVALATAGLVAATPNTAEAASPNSAQITRGEGGSSCFQALRGYTLTTHLLEVTTKSGITTLTCHFEDIADAPSKTAKYSGFTCSTFLGPITTDTKLVITPSGNGTLVCKIRK